MRVVIDIEADGLVNPTKIWCIVCKDIDTGEKHIFRNLTDDPKPFLEFAEGVSLWIGHNFLGYDYPVLRRILGFDCRDICDRTIDTLVISKLIDYPRQGHSIEAYGIEFEYPKGKNFYPDFFKEWSQELEDYCARDVDICHRIYLKYSRYINNPLSHKSIDLEQRFQLVCNDLHSNGFCFNTVSARALLVKVTEQLDKIDKEIEEAFQPRVVLIREFTPRATKFGTISKTSVPRTLWENISEYVVGETYRHTRLEPFNAASHKQLIQVLQEAGWVPEEKTQGHIDTERELNSLKYLKHKTTEVDLRLKELYTKLDHLKKFGWKINENNLSTLPLTAPSPARSLAKRILLEARRRTLTEWLGLVQEDGRIRGKFYGLGAWSHRMAHQNPNTANIPNELDTQGKKKLLGKELRALWRGPKNRLLVGVDAEGIQLRIFAHYINDAEFTKALVDGRKEYKTDPHSLNQRILGPVCKSRAGAKRFIYALLLGAGNGKLAQILEASKDETETALARLLERYEGFAELKRSHILVDGRRGWFTGLDGRKVRIPGETASGRSHLAMSGYLQNGEAVVMKLATLKWRERLKDVDHQLVNLVHDEWQTEVPNDMGIALHVAKCQADALREVGEELNLKCPLAGSYWNDDHKDYTIGTNWSVTH